MEKCGKLYEAIQFYRRAVQLVPDIEFRIDYIYKNKSRDIQTDDDLGKQIYTFFEKLMSMFFIDTDKCDEYVHTSSDSEVEEFDEHNFLPHIQKKVNKSQFLCLSAHHQQVKFIHLEKFVL